MLAHTHSPTHFDCALNVIISFWFLISYTVGLHAECANLLNVCIRINHVCVYGGQEVCLSPRVRGWGRLVLNRDGYWHSINMNENIFCVQGAWKEHHQMYRRDLFKQTLAISTQSNHLFTQQNRGGGYLVTCQAEGYFVTMNLWDLPQNLNSVEEIAPCNVLMKCLRYRWNPKETPQRTEFQSGAKQKARLLYCYIFKSY